MQFYRLFMEAMSKAKLKAPNQSKTKPQSSVLGSFSQSQEISKQMWAWLLQKTFDDQN
jgi:hypothetical protein